MAHVQKGIGPFRLKNPQLHDIGKLHQLASDEMRIHLRPGEDIQQFYKVAFLRVTHQDGGTGL